MSFKSIIVKGTRLVLSALDPKTQVYPQVVSLAPNQLLQGRCALITGGTSGIGYEIAKSFVNAGASVVITGRKQERNKTAVEQIRKDTGQKCVHAIQLDNLKVSEFNSRLAEAVSLVGKPIDILVNNAGLVGGEIRDCTEEKYDAILDTNLKGTFFLSQSVANCMKKNHVKGNILNVGSSSSLRPATSAYTISKWGVCGLTKGLAKILAPYGITVNGIAPGPTATPMLMPDGIREDMSFPTNPLGRFILPEEIANMAVFLVSEMGRSIIGDMVFMTGGSGVVTYDDVKYYF